MIVQPRATSSKLGAEAIRLKPSIMIAVSTCMRPYMNSPWR